jgi:hypothetical protein
MSSFLERLPFRWRKIGVVHVTAAIGIISSLKYIQYQHNQTEEKKKAEDMARRRKNREEREERERAQAAAQSQQPTTAMDAAVSSRA